MPLLPSACSRPERAENNSQSLSIRIRNRRKRYLDLHPEYFSSLELADPLLYDRLIRRFQTASEREAEGRKKGYSGILEADILRSEAKLDALAHVRGPDGAILAEETDDVPATKEEGLSRWRERMTWRFLHGKDSDFDYSAVDENEDFDDWAEEQRNEEDKYFEQEEPSWSLDDNIGNSGAECSGRNTLKGETGIQDF